MVLFGLMPIRSRFALFASILSFSALLWAGELPVLDDVETTMASENPTAENPAAEAGLRQSVKPAAATAAQAESQRPPARIRDGLSGRGEYAPLALFSVGSLAVGGAFYAINASSQRPNVTQTAGGRSSLSNAVGVAGLTALLAAGSYLYFSRDDSEPETGWDAQVSGGLAPDGALSASALLSFPLSSLFR